MVHSSMPTRFGVTRTYTKFIVGFVILSIILVFIIFYFSFSQALIQVTPRPSSVSSDFIADIDTVSGSPAAGVLPGQLYDTEVTLEKQYDATGSKDLEGDIVGQVMIYNTLENVQVLVEKTRLLTKDGILLRLKQRVEIPAKGKLETNVYADDPSAFESIPPTKFTIPGLNATMQTKVYAESFSTIKSKPGSVKVVKAVDLARGKEDLATAIYDEAVNKFKADVTSDLVAVVVAKKILSESVSAEVDDVVDKITIKQTMKITIIGIKQKDILDLAVERLNQLVSKDMELSNLNSNNLSYVVQNYNEEKKTANIKIHAEGETLLKENSEILDKGNLAGLSARGVELYLKSNDAIEDVTVTFSPFWVKTVPKMEDHITIEILKK
jgi:hypothetical protein